MAHIVSVGGAGTDYLTVVFDTDFTLSNNGPSSLELLTWQGWEGGQAWTRIGVNTMSCMVGTTTDVGAGWRITSAASDITFDGGLELDWPDSGIMDPAN